MRADLHKRGIGLRLKVYLASPFWKAVQTSSSQNFDDIVDLYSPSVATVIDVTYVDDEAAMLTAMSPKVLDVGIDVMIKAYVGAF